MSRKRDTNWSRDEITVLLDSIMGITKTNDGKKTNSREVFEFAAKKMAEKGHTSRAEREKCRTKWKKMKEEFTHAKKAREGDSRYKEAPGLTPFFDRMEEFINGSYDNISPHSTIVRRTSSLSSSQNTRLSSGSSNNNNNNTGSGNNMNIMPPTNINLPTSHQHQPTFPNGELCTLYNNYNSNNGNNVNSSIINSVNANTTASANLLNNSDDQIQIQAAEHADISYRVGTGCRQITIFGDHDVDIKFRRGCVTINKINVEYPSTTDT